MAGQEKPGHGEFCWNELATTDAAGAKKFYTELLGWTLKKGDAAPMAYTEIVVGDRQVGGIYQSGPGFGGGDRPPRWMAYVSVEDGDAPRRRAGRQGASSADGHSARRSLLRH